MNKVSSSYESIPDYAESTSENAIPDYAESTSENALDIMNTDSDNDKFCQDGI